MDLICKQKDCTKYAIWECTCIPRLRFCAIHAMPHSEIKNCNINNKTNEFKMIKKKAKDAQNALDQISFDIIFLANSMIEEINEVVRTSIMLIKTKKMKIINPKTGHVSRDFDLVINWAKTLNLRNRDKTIFSSTVKKLLKIKKKLEMNEIEIEKMKTKINSCDLNSLYEKTKLLSRSNKILSNLTVRKDFTIRKKSARETPRVLDLYDWKGK